MPALRGSRSRRWVSHNLVHRGCNLPPKLNDVLLFFRLLSLNILFLLVLKPSHLSDGKICCLALRKCTEKGRNTLKKFICSKQRAQSLNRSPCFYPLLSITHSFTNIKQAKGGSACRSSPYLMKILVVLLKAVLLAFSCIYSPWEKAGLNSAASLPSFGQRSLQRMGT